MAGRNLDEECWFETEQLFKSLLFSKESSNKKCQLLVTFGCRKICAKSQWILTFGLTFKFCVTPLKFHMNSKYRFLLLRSKVACQIIFKNTIKQQIRTTSTFWQCKSEITYSGGDGLCCARLLKAKLEAILPWVISCNRDGGGRGSNTVCSGNLCETVKQFLIKLVRQQRVTRLP